MIGAVEQKGSGSESGLLEVVQVYGFCTHTLHLPVIFAMKMELCDCSAMKELSVSDGTFCYYQFQTVFVRTTHSSKYVYFRWSRVRTAVKTIVTTSVFV